MKRYVFSLIGIALIATPIAYAAPNYIEPEEPSVQQGVCLEEPWTFSDPIIEFDKITNKHDIDYELTQGILKHGRRVTITARVTNAYIFSETIPGWNVSEDQLSATRSIVLPDAPNCEVETIQLEEPSVKNAYCTIDSDLQTSLTWYSVSLPDNTNKVSYRLDGEVEIGWTITITAEAAIWYVFDDKDWWKFNAFKTKASKTITLKNIQCKWVDIGTEEIIQASCLPGLRDASIKFPKDDNIEYKVIGWEVKPWSVVTIQAKVKGDNIYLNKKSWRIRSSDATLATKNVNIKKTSCSDNSNDQPEDRPWSGDVYTSCSLRWSDFSDEMERAYIFACASGMTKRTDIKSADLYSLASRAEFSKIMSIYATRILNKKPDTKKSCHFDDLRKIAPDLKDYAQQSCQLGLMGINTRDQLFWPYWSLMRAEVVTIISRLFNWAEDHRDPSQYWANHMDALFKKWYVTKPDPNRLELRGYAFLILERITYKEFPNLRSYYMKPFDYKYSDI